MSGSGAGLDISVGNAQINPKSHALPMKILFVADLHQRQDWFEWVARQSTRYEMLAIAGDLQDAFSDTSMHDQARTISEWLCALRTPTVVCSGNHDYRHTDMRYRHEPITLANGVWIGACTFVGPGVEIGTDAVIAACAMVTKSLEGGWVYAGKPCRRVRQRWAEDAEHTHHKRHPRTPVAPPPTEQVHPETGE